MAELYASQIIKGRRTFDSVPAKLKEQVAEILLSEGFADLVPIEFGGTLK